MIENLESLGQEALDYLNQKNTAREQALPRARTLIRYCANSIRAAHRREFAAAEELLAKAAELLAQIGADLREQPDVFYAGFVQDAQKEYAEAAAFLALIQGRALPHPQSLKVDWAPYLNGLGEAVGELRRYVLDRLRHGWLAECEQLLQHMDDIYALLITIDFPDAITGGLRRTTDTTRAILEKTRGDLTVAVRQAQLEEKISELLGALHRKDAASS
ncbi:haloacid dehalogenase [Thermogemmatispora sp.]|uniref:haloacid dehalogenase n=1 Tax=Thermogemmatispora sp. TaxID=1968838 RepID=UPI0035E4625B